MIPMTLSSTDVRGATAAIPNHVESVGYATSAHGRLRGDARRAHWRCRTCACCSHSTRRLLLAAGLIDISFANALATLTVRTAEAQMTDLAMTPDGRIVATGSSASGLLTVARFHADGSLDPTFGDNGRATSRIGEAEVLAAAVQPDHQIVVAGQRDQEFFLLRYRINGKHDRFAGRAFRYAAVAVATLRLVR